MWLCRLLVGYACACGLAGCSLIVPLDGFDDGQPPAAGSAPFRGTPLPLPGRIEAEDFDLGGEGVAYHDVDPQNRFGKFRPDDGVDIYADGSDFAIGWRATDEWTVYSVDVAESGVYRIGVRLMAGTSDTGGTHVHFGGVDRTGRLVVPDADRGRGWVMVWKAEVALEAGRQQVRVMNGRSAGGSSGYCGNLDYLVVER